MEARQVYFLLVDMELNVLLVQQHGLCDDDRSNHYTLYCCNEFSEPILHIEYRIGFTVYIFHKVKMIL